MSTTLTSEEKKKFIKTLEEDREFRYMVMGFLGYREILDRITRIEERQQKLEEKQYELEKKMVDLETRMVKLEERMIKLEERQQKLEERMVKLEERQQKLEERLVRVEEELVRVRRLAELNRRDIGAITESLYSRWVWEDLRDELKSRGEVIVRKIRNYVVDGEEIDLLVEARDRVYVVEVKIQPDHYDVDDLLNKAMIVRERFGKETIAILAGVWIGDEVVKYAMDRNVKIMVY